MNVQTAQHGLGAPDVVRQKERGAALAGGAQQAQRGLARQRQQVVAARPAGGGTRGSRRQPSSELCMWLEQASQALSLALPPPHPLSMPKFCRRRWNARGA